MTAPRRQRAGLVRSYTPAQAADWRTTRRVDDATLLYADAKLRREGLESTARRVMDLCLKGPLCVAEVSAHLALGRPITKGVVGHLAESGHLVLKDPRPDQEQHSIEFLERVLHGLKCL